jgi:hypothetical protein
MKPTFVLILFLAFSVMESGAQPTATWVLVSVEACLPEQLAELGSFDPHGVSMTSRGLTAVLRGDDLPLLDSVACRYEILIPDLTVHYQNRAIADFKDRIEDRGLATEEDIDPVHFRLGPVAGSYTFEEFPT